MRPSSASPARIGSLALNRRARGVWGLVWLACLFGIVSSAGAHERTPAVLTLQEVAADQFRLRWSPPTPNVDDLVLTLPAQCSVEGLSRVHLGRMPASQPVWVACDAPGLAGELTFQSERNALGRIGVTVARVGMEPSFELTVGSPPTLTLEPRLQSPTRVLWQYVGLGVEHIWFGWDHLLFLLGLLLLVRGRRSLVATVTAFTAAHSVTLTAASLDLLEVPIAPVEICIALSVSLLAVEVHAGPNTVTRRHPWSVALAFGLLHGLGFASALADVGLPPDAVSWSLLGFNLGVELGQLVVVALVALLLAGLKGHLAVRSGIESLASGALGICSTFWLLERIEGWLRAHELL